MSLAVLFRGSAILHRGTDSLPPFYQLFAGPKGFSPCNEEELL